MERNEDKGEEKCIKKTKKSEFKRTGDLSRIPLDTSDLISSNEKKTISTKPYFLNFFNKRKVDNFQF